MKKILSVLLAAFMLLTLPIMTGIARTYADGETESEQPMAHTHRWGEPDWTFRFTLADGSTVDVTNGLDPDGNHFDANQAYWIEVRYATFTCETCSETRTVDVPRQTHEVVEDDQNAAPSIEFSCPMLLDHAEVDFNGQTYTTTAAIKLDSGHANAGWFLFYKDDSYRFKNEYRFTEKDDNGDYVLEVEDLPLDVEVWVVYAVNCPETNGQGHDLPYAPFGKAGDMENRLYTTEETSGHVKIYFNPECHDEWKDFYEVGFCYIEKIEDEPQEPIATITINAVSETAAYDGEEHAAIGFKGVFENENMTKEFESDHSTETNEHVTIFRGDWNATPREYKIVVTTADPTEIEAGVYPNTVTNVKVYVDGNDVTNMFTIVTNNGNLTILDEPIATITINAWNTAVVYDGEEHAAIGFTGIYENANMTKAFVSDQSTETNEHVAEFAGDWNGLKIWLKVVVTTADPTEIEAGMYPNTITDVKVYDGEADVTAFFNIVTNDGKLNILAEPIATITINAWNTAVVYDGEEHAAIGFTGIYENANMTKAFVSDQSTETNEHFAEFAGDWNGLKIGLKVVVTTADPTEIEAGVYPNTITDVKVYDGEADVTAFFNIVTNNGELNIYKALFRVQSLLLTGQIAMRWYMDLSLLTEDEREGSYMTFAFDNGRKGPARLLTDRDDFVESHKVGDLYYFTCKLSAMQMANNIVATYHYGENQELTVSKTYSIEQYFEMYDENKDLFTAKQQAAVETLADYGYHAQKFLASIGALTIGSKYAEITKHYTDSYDIDEVREALAAYEIVKTNKTNGDIEEIYFSVSLADMPIINVDFVAAEGYEGGIVVKQGSNTLEVTQSISNEGKTVYRVQIKDMPAHLMGKVYTLKATTTNGTATVKVSVLSYLNQLLNSETYGDNALAQNTAASMYYYYKAAYDLKYGD